MSIPNSMQSIYIQILKYKWSITKSYPVVRFCGIDSVAIEINCLPYILVQRAQNDRMWH